MKILLTIILLSTSSCIDLGGRQNKAQIIESMANTLLKQYPDTPTKKVKEVAKTDLLVDVRDAKERLVSTLPGAISKEDFIAKFDVLRTRTIVAYDTIGQRSVPWVKELKQKGLLAYNLHGGILAWAQNGGSFVDITGQETKRVHVYAEAWEMLPEGFEAITQ
tara:strand:+ start:1514 stop:2002 length:489 start_codon:yes stop_codon:yes gene_type:complete